MADTTMAVPVRDMASGFASIVTSYRRNGKLQSCEPCRRGKLRCDHTVPTCGRCVRRRKPEQCVYHPAPLTKARQASAQPNTKSSTPSLRTKSLSQEPHNATSRSKLMSPPATGTPRRADARSDSYTSLSARAYSRAVLGSAPSSTYPSESSDSMAMKDMTGYLGSSSYSAFFTENNEELDNDIPDRPVAGHDSPSRPTVTADNIAKGAEILSLLCDLELWEQLLEREFEIADGIMITRPIYYIWIKEIHRHFDTTLASVTDQTDLYVLSELVWRNTYEPWHACHLSGTEWATLASGQNLRWETVGLIFSVIGILASGLSDWDAIFTGMRDKIKDRRTLVRRMRDVVETCVSFCKECETINDLFVCLIYESTVLLESIRGEAYYGAWQRMGETCDLAVLMGMHQAQERDPHVSFFVDQMRRSMFVEIFGHDKSLATFLGRPPRLSHRYCHLELPLDLGDDELLLHGQELQDVVSKLKDGWNTSNRFSRNTWRRVWSYYLRNREDILEISLGTNADISERAAQIQTELQQVYDNMPDFVKTDPSVVLSRIQPGSHFSILGWEADRLPLYVMHLVIIHCAMRQTAFSLKRALVNRNKVDPRDMVPEARSLFQLVLQIIAKREYLRDYQADFVALLAYHGLPSAGVLAIELLKQEQTRVYTPELLPRSETIQELSVFISALATIGPGEGNHAVCNQGRKALKRLLDKVLSPQPVPALATAVQQAGGAALDVVEEGVLHFPTGNDAEFLQWLEDVEWDRPSWLGAM